MGLYALKKRRTVIRDDGHRGVFEHYSRQRPNRKQDIKYSNRIGVRKVFRLFWKEIVYDKLAMKIATFSACTAFSFGNFERFLLWCIRKTLMIVGKKKNS